ncbi:MAG TPA: VIT1/CCC1 transporter family protein [Thermoanaerobaculia bacterium]|jgi:VIT1/CCC1 family predicted Fe2+/Mn2+ transporter
MTVATALKPWVDNRRRVLSPSERFGESVFGLIMVLTITGSLSVAEAGHTEVRTMLIGALGCNTAWGLVDAVMYLLGSLFARGRNRAIVSAIRARTTDAAQGRALVADELPPLVASVLRDSDLDFVRRKLAEMPEPPRPRLNGEDLFGALGVFVLVFLSTFPVVLPFLFASEPHLALRLSNAVGVALLFFCGFAMGRYGGLRPVLSGLVMAAIGAALVAATMALGG